jgi:hypothetical protein
MGKLQQEFFFGAAMSDVPDAAWNVMPMISCHASPPCTAIQINQLSICYGADFTLKKSTYRLLLAMFFESFSCDFDGLIWPDPGPPPGHWTTSLFNPQSPLTTYLSERPIPFLKTHQPLCILSIVQT